jgi:undecaprenyl-diphosphatase
MDEQFFTAIQSLAGTKPLFDRVVSHIATNPLLKGGLPMLVFWSLWFTNAGDRARVRSRLIAVLGVSAVALAASRIITGFLPFRLRPLHTADVQMLLSFDHDPTVLSGWSAFPSDHAVMFFAIAGGFWQIRRRAGAVTLVHAFVAIAFGRVFLGYHWPSDVLAGMLIGLVVAALLLRPLAGLVTWLGITGICDRFEGVAYPALFLLSWQVATMFDAVRALAGALFRLTAMV